MSFNDKLTQLPVYLQLVSLGSPSLEAFSTRVMTCIPQLGSTSYSFLTCGTLPFPYLYLNYGKVAASLTSWDNRSNCQKSTKFLSGYILTCVSDLYLLLCSTI